MRRTLLSAIAFIFGATAMYSQAYLSVSGGYGFKTHQKVLGRDATDPTAITSSKGVMEKDTKHNYEEDIFSISVGEVN